MNLKELYKMNKYASKRQSKQATLQQKTIVLLQCCLLSIYQKLRTTFITLDIQQVEPFIIRKNSLWPVKNAINTVIPKKYAENSNCDGNNQITGTCKIQPKYSNSEKTTWPGVVTAKWKNDVKRDKRNPIQI